MPNVDSPDSDGDTGSSAYGVRITHYRLFTQAAPGLIVLLMLLQTDLVPEKIRPFHQDPTWEKLTGIGVPVLLLALPAGFVLSGVSFFILGSVVFPLRDCLWRCRPVTWLLTQSLGELRTQRAGTSSGRWTRYIGDVGFILRRHSFRGPREDAPDKVIAVAIFARSLALLTIIYGALRRLEVLGDWAGPGRAIEAGLIIGVFLLLLFFSAFFELYRDYSLVVAAEQFEDYHQFEEDAIKGPEAIKHARKLLGNATPECSRQAPHNQAAPADG